MHRRCGRHGRSGRRSGSAAMVAGYGAVVAVFVVGTVVHEHRSGLCAAQGLASTVRTRRADGPVSDRGQPLCRRADVGYRPAIGSCHRGGLTNARRTGRGACGALHEQHVCGVRRSGHGRRGARPDRAVAGPPKRRVANVAAARPSWGTRVVVPTARRKEGGQLAGRAAGGSPRWGLSLRRARVGATKRSLGARCLPTPASRHRPPKTTAGRECWRFWWCWKRSTPHARGACTGGCRPSFRRCGVVPAPLA